MTETLAIIQNKAGIHCRPTALLIKEALEYSGTIRVTAPSGSCRLGSALELMMLGLEQGTTVVLQVEGPDEVSVAERFKTLFETNFDFPHACEGEINL